MNRKKIIRNIPVEGGDANVIRVDIHYNVGGMNYFTARKEARGLYMSVSPLQVGDRFTTYNGFSGVKVLVKEMSRYSEKALYDFQPDQELVDRMVNRVAEYNNLKIVEPCQK